MTLSLIGKAVLVWAGILVLAVVNGAVREAVIIPALGLPYALILSGVLLMLLIFLVTYLSLPWLDTRKTTQLIVIGFGWLCLTLAFEFSFGLLQGKSISELLDAYTFNDGNIWPLVLLATASAPYLAAKFRGWV
ncbi:MAG: hypothetical protein KKE76_09720 [Gammaproteobacteria bacterium]|nr:hypothetical protein [Gammaproteobacteria bacterium]